MEKTPTNGNPIVAETIEAAVIRAAQEAYRLDAAAQQLRQEGKDYEADITEMDASDAWQKVEELAKRKHSARGGELS